MLERGDGCCWGNKWVCVEEVGRGKGIGVSNGGEDGGWVGEGAHG